MHFENVSILINAVSDILKDMNYCWRDKQGHICSQIGVFRVNCIDCLDRTNVVQVGEILLLTLIRFQPQVVIRHRFDIGDDGAVLQLKHMLHIIM